MYIIKENQGYNLEAARDEVVIAGCTDGIVKGDSVF